MRILSNGLRRYGRAAVTVASALVLVAVSYALARELELWTIRRFQAGKANAERGEWNAAIRCFDSALRWNHSLTEAWLLRATAINAVIQDTLESTGHPPRGRTRDQALADLDRYLRQRPRSGEAYYQRGLALAGLARVEASREALAQAIRLLDDPTQALVDRAALSFHAGEYATAVHEMSRAIERRPLVAEFYETRASYRPFVKDPVGARHDLARAVRLRESAETLTLEDLKALEADQGDYRPVMLLQDEPEAARERRQMLGRWSVAARETAGQKEPLTGRDCSVTFDPDRYTLVLDGTIQQRARYRVDPLTRPRRIDWVATVGGREVTFRGVYERQADTLFICLAEPGKPRPVELASGGRRNATLYTLRRSNE